MKITQKKSFRSLFALLPAVAVGGFLLHQAQPANALSGWKAGNIIDNYVMTNKSTMSVNKIQSFLNSKVPNCDTNGQKLSEYGGPDLNHDGKVQRWEWGKANYNQTKFPCLRDYKQDGKTSARIIYDAAQKYNINPQVLIVLLQKEQNLVQDTWPLKIQYRSATGYGCPDTADCNSKYYGFKNQVNWAATMFRAILNDSPTWYTPYELGKNYIQYNPSASCGGSTVNIQNRATQALYNYTPYQPNKGALSAGWGTAHCGAYGNRNFFLYFNSWFGSTRMPTASDAQNAIEARYSELGAVSGILGLQIGAMEKNSDGNYWQSYEHGYIIWTKTTGAWESTEPIRGRWSALGLKDSGLGYPDGPVTKNGDGSLWQKYQDGFIVGNSSVGYWESKNGIRDRWSDLGRKDSALGYPVGPVVQNSDGTVWQQYEDGYILWKSGVGSWESMGPIREHWSNLGRRGSTLGYPAGPIKTNEDGSIWQEYEHGYIVGNTITGYWESFGSIRNRWYKMGLKDSTLGFPTGSVNATADRKGFWQKYQNGFILGTAHTGYWESTGPIRERWSELHRVNGELGYPTGPILNSNGKLSQVYEGGEIFYSSVEGTSVTYN